MSQLLIIFATDENDNFDPEKIIKIVSSIDGVDGDVVPNSMYKSYLGTYIYQEEETYFEVADNLSYISLKDLNNAAFRFAMNLQRSSDVNLSVTDDSNSFMYQLSKISSIEEFRDIVSQEIYMDQ